MAERPPEIGVAMVFLKDKAHPAMPDGTRKFIVPADWKKGDVKEIAVWWKTGTTNSGGYWEAVFCRLGDPHIPGIKTRRYPKAKHPPAPPPEPDPEVSPETEPAPPEEAEPVFDDEQPPDDPITKF